MKMHDRRLCGIVANLFSMATSITPDAEIHENAYDLTTYYR